MFFSFCEIKNDKRPLFFAKKAYICNAKVGNDLKAPGWWNW